MSQEEQHSTSRSSTTLSALSSIAPAVASTACCWGPAVLSLGAGGSSAAAARLSQISRFRPYLLTLSASMISYSFYRVYGPPIQQEHACCKTEAEKERHAQRLKINRAVVWASLGVALVGASYGRVPLPKYFRNNNSLVAGPMGTTTTAAIGSMASSSSQVLKFQVQGMHCGGCSNKVKNAVESVGGIQKATVDHKTGSVLVEGGMNEEAIKSAITKAGYVVIK